MLEARKMSPPLPPHQHSKNSFHDMLAPALLWATPSLPTQGQLGITELGWKSLPQMVI